MKIPNAEKAIINKKKFLEYLLSTTHPIGRHKAAFFYSYGFDFESAEFFIRQLKTLVQETNFKKTISTDFGTKYIVDGVIQSPTGKQLELTTIWFIEKGNDITYFVTAYPRRK